MLGHAFGREREVQRVALELTKDSIDIGVVVSDSEKALAFYRDTLGFEHVADTPMPGGGTMHRLMCGTSMVKLVKLEKNPQAAVPGGIQGGLGNRYWTISVSNLQEAADACEAAGYRVAVPVRRLRPEISIAIIEDPDGNWVEFVQHHAEG
ncbi:MAG: VOC family protein [Tepidiformaceae bacterium]